MSSKEKYEVIVLFNGYSKTIEEGALANCTCTLLKGPKNIIVDTMTAWDGQKLLNTLKQHNIECDDIDFVICTHGHSDHIGCNYLFKKATHIIGTCISHKDMYFQHNFKEKEEYIIDADVKVLATPGHTLQDISVIVKTEDMGVIAITGDLFENEHDLKDDSIWMEAGSDSEELQRENRSKILALADWIIPGHGPMFKISKERL